jgi:hypothetical protein
MSGVNASLLMAAMATLVPRVAEREATLPLRACRSQQRLIAQQKLARAAAAAREPNQQQYWSCSVIAAEGGGRQGITVYSRRTRTGQARAYPRSYERHRLVVGVPYTAPPCLRSTPYVVPAAWLRFTIFTAFVRRFCL